MLRRLHQRGNHRVRFGVYIVLQDAVDGCPLQRGVFLECELIVDGLGWRIDHQGHGLRIRQPGSVVDAIAKTRGSAKALWIVIERAILLQRHLTLGCVLHDDCGERHLVWVLVIRQDALIGRD